MSRDLQIHKLKDDTHPVSNIYKWGKQVDENAVALLGLGSGPVTFEDGTLAEPGIRFTNDTDTGFQRGTVIGSTVLRTVVDGTSILDITDSALTVAGKITAEGSIQFTTANENDLLQSNSIGEFEPTSIVSCFQDGSNVNSLTIGGNAAVNATSFGIDSEATTAFSSAFGRSTSCEGTTSNVFGASSFIGPSSENCNVFGYGSSVSAFQNDSLIFGNNTAVTGSNVVCIGNAITGSSSGGISIGNASSPGSFGISIGHSTQSGTSSVALGNASNSAGFSTVSVGANSDSGTYNGCTTIGCEVSATANNQLSIGVGGSGGNRLVTDLSVSTTAATLLEGYLPIKLNGTDYYIPLHSIIPA
jgi:hypothetical protein